MSDGVALRATVNDVEGFVDIIKDLNSYQAIALGAMKKGLPERVDVATKDRLNGNAGVIARDQEHISYRKGKPAFVLIDVDRKGMPQEMRKRIGDDIWGTLCTVLPALRNAAHVIRRSTSAGLHDGETPLPSSGGWHIYLVLKDGRDAKNFLKALHDHCWLAGFGWYYISKAGSLLERSIVDTSVYAPERLVFEGPPIVHPPLWQDAETRKAHFAHGDMVDMSIVILDPNADRQLSQTRSAEHARIRPEAEKVKVAWVEEHAQELHTRKGMPIEEARRKILAVCEKQQLHPDHVLEFVDPDLRGATVADVLADPQRFCDKSLADPIEGVTYGRTTAKVFLRDGVPWINSFAHGGVQYTLVPEFKPPSIFDFNTAGPQGSHTTNGAGAGSSAGSSAGGSGGGAGTNWTGASAAGASPNATSLLKPAICVEPGELPRVVDEAEDALLKFDREIYQRNGMLVRPTLNTSLKTSGGRKTASWQLIEVTQPYLIDQLSNAAQFQKHDKRAKKYVIIDPPDKVAEIYIHRRGGWRLPHLVGVVNAPFLRADGSICETAGYDADSRVLFKPETQIFPSVPQQPSKADAEVALAKLKKLIETFPFVTDADRSVALAAMLTVLDRRSMAHAPLIGFSAPAARTGKSLLVKLMGIIATGRAVPVKSQGRDEKEFENRLGGNLIAGDVCISIDNCSRPLAGDMLCSALTENEVEVRVLGFTRNVKTATIATIFATGNNLIVDGDLSDRCLISSMDAGVERPGLRKFSIDIEEETHDRRGELVVAVLTILRAWHVARKQGACVNIDVLGGFEEWSWRVREPLIWLGEADPCDTIKKVLENDSARDELESVAVQWKEHLGVGSLYTIQELVGRAMNIPTLYTALMSVAANKTGGVISNDRLGRWLKQVEGRIVGGLKLVRAGTQHGYSTWSLRQ